MSARRLGIALAGALLLSAGAAHADKVDLDFNADAFRAAYTLTREASGIEYDFSWLHDSDEGDVGAVGLHVLGLTGSQSSPWEAGIGGKLFFVDTDDDTGGALGLGGYLDHRFAQLDWLAVGGHAYYAPDALGFSGLESLLHAGIRAGFVVHERAIINVGLRLVKVDFKDVRSTDVDEGFNIGLRLVF